MATFFELPTELHEMIIGYLEFPSDVRLKHTNHYFIRLIKPVDIWEAEKSYFACMYRIYACNVCSTLRPFWRFSDKNRKGKRGTFHSEATKRFCIPCGLKQGPSGKSQYGPGDRVFVSRKLYFICKACSQFKKSPDGERTDMCADCLDNEDSGSGRSCGEGVSNVPPSESAITTDSVPVLHPLYRNTNEPSYLEIYERLTYASPKSISRGARLRGRSSARRSREPAEQCFG